MFGHFLYGKAKLCKNYNYRFRSENYSFKIYNEIFQVYFKDLTWNGRLNYFFISSYLIICLHELLLIYNNF